MSHFAKKHKYHISLLVLLLTITGLSAFYLLKTKPSTAELGNYQPPVVNRLENNKTRTTTSEGVNEKQAEATSTSSVAQNSTTNYSIPEKEQPEKLTVNNCQNNCISAVLNINNKQYQLRILPQTTVYQAMELAQQQTNMAFAGQAYASLGYFVEEIDGIKNNPQKSQYWIYYINGQSAQTGISTYQIKSKDIITWKYEKAKF